METNDLDAAIGKNMAKYCVERGEKRMKVQTLHRAAQALHVSCDALLSSDEAAGHMYNIHKLLAEQPAEHLAGPARIIRVCAEEFNAKREKET